MMTWVQIGDYNLLDDFGLFCSGYEVGAPEAQRYTVDIPGRDGALDITDMIFGGIVHYNNRDITIELDAVLANPRVPWPDIQSAVMDAIHGRTMDIIFGDDPDFYWTGACSVSGTAEDGALEIEVDAEPYKKAVKETVRALDGSGEIVLRNLRMRAIPTITVTDDATISDGATELTLEAGTYEAEDLTLDVGETTWTITSSGTTTITYRQGRL